ERQNAGVPSASSGQALPLRQAQGQDDTRFGGSGASSRAGDSFLRHEQPELRAIETPLMFGGFSPETVERFGDKFRAMGLTPVAGLGGGDPTAVQPERLVAGRAVSAGLVRGDLSMAGTWTV